jgi:hypothetical protein
MTFHNDVIVDKFQYPGLNYCNDGLHRNVNNHHHVELKQVFIHSAVNLNCIFSINNDGVNKVESLAS